LINGSKIKEERVVRTLKNSPNEFDPLRFYNEKRVKEYARRNFLCPPEQRIIEKFSELWREWALLDIGVGGGRTTRHFAPLVRRYVGLDYVPEMVDTCQRNFLSGYENCEFRVGDVRRLNGIDDEEFNFLLFSYNGLGEVPSIDQEVALREMRRVIKKGGFLFFSQMNLLWVPDLFRFKFAKRPDRCMRQIRNTLRLRKRNPDWRKISAEKQAILFHYVYDLTQPQLFIEPRYQAEKLELIGLSKIQIYLNSTGELWDMRNNEAIKHEPYVYYLAQRPMNES